MNQFANQFRTGDHAIAVDRLDKQVGVVGQPCRDAPTGEAVVPDREDRRAREHRPDDGPLRRVDVRQIPRRRDRRPEVRIARQQWLTRCGTLRTDDPVIRATPARHVLFEHRQILPERIEKRRVNGRGRIVRIGNCIDGAKRIDTVVAQNPQTGEFAIPVRRQRERLQLHDTENVAALVRRTLAAENREFVRLLRQPHGTARVHPRRERGQRGLHVGIDDRKLCDRRTVKADATAHAIDRQALRTDEFRERATDHP